VAPVTASIARRQRTQLEIDVKFRAGAAGISRRMDVSRLTEGVDSISLKYDRAGESHARRGHEPAKCGVNQLVSSKSKAVLWYWGEGREKRKS
jgi:hypothetical protein